MNCTTGSDSFSSGDDVNFVFGTFTFNMNSLSQQINADGSLIMSLPNSIFSNSGAGGYQSSTPIWWQVTAGVDDDRKSYLRKLGKADVLFEFFGKDIHGLITIGDDGAKAVPFMDRFGMIWLMEGENQWAAFDKVEFRKFLDDDQATDYYGPKLNKQQVMERLADPGNKE